MHPKSDIDLLSSWFLAVVLAKVVSGVHFWLGEPWGGGRASTRQTTQRASFHELYGIDVRATIYKAARH